MSEPQAHHEQDPAALAAAELAQEVRVGGSAAGRAANAALLALSRTARSFTLYDARNQAVRGFLADLRTKVMAALEAHDGPLEFEVRPFELALHGEVVYVERERERSLAFKLYRDGIRSLSLLPGLAWDDLLGLVEILSLRYSGVRQQEDDIVTLLSKADFRHLRFSAIEGFGAEEELQEGDEERRPHVAPPPDWDLPLPALPLAAPVAVRTLPPETVAALRTELGDSSVATEALELVLELLERVDDPAEGLDEEHIEVLVFEVRDYLLSEGRFGELLRMVTALEHSAAGDMRPRPSILARFGEREPLRQLIRRQHRLGEDPPEEAFVYLRRVPGNPLAELIEMLASERDDSQRATLCAFIAGLCEDRPRLLLERIEGADARLACELLGALQRALPGLAVDAALKLCARPEPVLQLAAVQTLGAAAFTPSVGRALVHALSAKQAEVRAAAVLALAGFRDPRIQEALEHHAQECARHGLTEQETETLGEALAGQDPTLAFELFSTWLHPQTLLQRVTESPAHRALHRVAVAGLGRLPGAEAEQLLRWFLGKCSGDLHQYCLATLVQRRRQQHDQAGGHAG